jgi:hypothetical protein
VIPEYDDLPPVPFFSKSTGNSFSKWCCKEELDEEADSFFAGDE